MEKNIRDYLHLYLGCEASYYNKGFSFSPIVGKLDDISDLGCYVGKKNVPCNYFRFIKLHLRSLYDMTEEEALELIRIHALSIWGDYRFNKWYAIKDPKSDKNWSAWDIERKGGKESFVIHLTDGDIVYYDSEGLTDQSEIDSNYRFWYLKKGFDIFDLIEAGLAIEKTKLTTHA